MNHPSLQTLFAATAAVLASTSVVHAQFTRTETFDTGPGFFTSESGNQSGGNSFGFSNTNNTAGASPAGEIGGTFARTSGFSHIADAALGGSFSRSDDFSLSGELVFTAANNPDGTIGIGYFNTGNPGFEAVGLNIAEPPSPGQGFRVFLMIRDNTGAQLLSGLSSVPLNSPTTFSLTYDGNPDGSGTLSGTVGGQFQTVSGPANASSVFDGFGIGAGYVGTNNAGLTASAFADNLSYSVLVPEPGSIALLLSCTAIFAGRRLRRSSGV